MELLLRVDPALYQLLAECFYDLRHAGEKFILLLLDFYADIELLLNFSQAGEECLLGSLRDLVAH